jgi:hypothetical protein
LHGQPQPPLDKVPWDQAISDQIIEWYNTGDGLWYTWMSILGHGVGIWDKLDDELSGSTSSSSDIATALHDYMSAEAKVTAFGDDSGSGKLVEALYDEIAEVCTDTKDGYVRLIGDGYLSGIDEDPDALTFDEGDSAEDWEVVPVNNMPEDLWDKLDDYANHDNSEGHFSDGYDAQSAAGPYTGPDTYAEGTAASDEDEDEDEIEPAESGKIDLYDEDGGYLNTWDEDEADDAETEADDIGGYLVDDQGDIIHDARSEEDDEEEPEPEPEYGDYVKSPSGRYGGQTSVDRINEGHVGTASDDEEADQMIREDAEAQQVWPSVWIQDDHGGMTLDSDFEWEVEEEVTEPQSGDYWYQELNDGSYDWGFWNGDMEVEAGDTQKQYDDALHEIFKHNGSEAPERVWSVEAWDEMGESFESGEIDEEAFEVIPDSWLEDQPIYGVGDRFKLHDYFVDAAGGFFTPFTEKGTKTDHIEITSSDKGAMSGEWYYDFIADDGTEGRIGEKLLEELATRPAPNRPKLTYIEPEEAEEDIEELGRAAPEAVNETEAIEEAATWWARMSTEGYGLSVPQHVRDFVTEIRERCSTGDCEAWQQFQKLQTQKEMERSFAPPSLAQQAPLRSPFLQPHEEGGGLEYITPSGGPPRQVIDTPRTLGLDDPWAKKWGSIALSPEEKQILDGAINTMLDNTRDDRDAPDPYELAQQDEEAFRNELRGYLDIETDGDEALIERLVNIPLEALLDMLWTPKTAQSKPQYQPFSWDVLWAVGGGPSFQLGKVDAQGQYEVTNLDAGNQHMLPEAKIKRAVEGGRFTVYRHGELTYPPPDPDARDIDLDDDRVMFSVRTMNGLYYPKGGDKPIKTLGELADMTQDEIRARKHLSMKTVKEVREVLAEFGLQLRGDAIRHAGVNTPIRYTGGHRGQHGDMDLAPAPGSGKYVRVKIGDEGKITGINGNNIELEMDSGERGMTTYSTLKSYFEVALSAPLGTEEDEESEQEDVSESPEVGLDEPEPSEPEPEEPTLESRILEEMMAPAPLVSAEPTRSPFLHQPEEPGIEYVTPGSYPRTRMIDTGPRELRPGESWMKKGFATRQAGAWIEETDEQTATDLIQKVIDDEGWDCDSVEIDPDLISYHEGQLIDEIETVIADFEDNVHKSKDFKALEKDLEESLPDWTKFIEEYNDGDDIWNVLDGHYDDEDHIQELMDTVHGKQEVQDAFRDFRDAVNEAASEACKVTVYGLISGQDSGSDIDWIYDNLRHAEHEAEQGSERYHHEGYVIVEGETTRKALEEAQDSGDMQSLDSDVSWGDTVSEGEEHPDPEYMASNWGEPVWVLSEKDGWKAWKKGTGWRDNEDETFGEWEWRTADPYDPNEQPYDEDNELLDTEAEALQAAAQALLDAMVAAGDDDQYNHRILKGTGYDEYEYLGMDGLKKIIAGEVEEPEPEVEEPEPEVEEPALAAPEPEVEDLDAKIEEAAQWWSRMMVEGFGLAVPDHVRAFVEEIRERCTRDKTCDWWERFQRRQTELEMERAFQPSIQQQPTSSPGFAQPEPGYQEIRPPGPTPHSIEMPSRPRDPYEMYGLPSMDPWSKKSRRRVVDVTDDGRPVFGPKRAVFIKTAMEPEYVQEDFYEIETTVGTEVVPVSVTGYGTRQQPPNCWAISDYLEGECDDPNDIPTIIPNKIWTRLHEPGYMDASSWDGPHDTLHDARKMWIVDNDMDPDTGGTLYDWIYEAKNGDEDFQERLERLAEEFPDLASKGYFGDALGGTQRQSELQQAYDAGNAAPAGASGRALYPNDPGLADAFSMGNYDMWGGGFGGAPKKTRKVVDVDDAGRAVIAITVTAADLGAM